MMVGQRQTEVPLTEWRGRAGDKSLSEQCDTILAEIYAKTRRRWPLLAATAVRNFTTICQSCGTLCLTACMIRAILSYA